jgi:hypothetical protein
VCLPFVFATPILRIFRHAERTTRAAVGTVFLVDVATTVKYLPAGMSLFGQRLANR